MHSPEALILRRCYPVPVTFKDLRAAYLASYDVRWRFKEAFLHEWTAALKETTGALDEVYAVVDGREVRVATASSAVSYSDLTGAIADCGRNHHAIVDLLDKADRAGYWARPHEVRLDLQERPISRETVAQAVLVGQQYLERSGDGGAA